MNTHGSEVAAVAAAIATAHATQGAPAGTHQYLTFAVGVESYAAQIDSIREILEVPAMTVVPLMPAFVRGVINLRGAVVPVIDLAARLDQGATEIGRRSCVVVVEVIVDGQAPLVLGVLVDAVHEVLDIAGTDIEPTPALGTRIDARFIRGMAKVAKRLIVVLDLGRVLAQDELANMVASHAAA